VEGDWRLSLGAFGSALWLPDAVVASPPAVPRGWLPSSPGGHRDCARPGRLLGHKRLRHRAAAGGGGCGGGCGPEVLDQAPQGPPGGGPVPKKRRHGGPVVPLRLSPSECRSAGAGRQPGELGRLGCILRRPLVPGETAAVGVSGGKPRLPAAGSPLRHETVALSVHGGDVPGSGGAPPPRSALVGVHR